ncbi:MAG: nucleotidyltransferase family protein [Chloroflexota bacterium]
MTPKLAVLLAAGRGKRLRPHTDTTPKPLLPVNGRPTLDFTLQAAVKAGVKQVVFVIGHLGDQIIEYIEDGATWGIEPYFCEQKELLGTAHALKIAIDAHPQLFKNSDSFILTATDYLFDPTVLSELVEKQGSTAADIVVSLKEVPKEELSGRSSVRYTGDFEIQEIVEKPAAGQAPSPYSGSLTFLLPSKIVNYVPNMQMSQRGEYEIQALVNQMILDSFSARGVLQPAPNEWNPSLAIDH